MNILVPSVGAFRLDGYFPRAVGGVDVQVHGSPVGLEKDLAGDPAPFFPEASDIFLVVSLKTWVDLLPISQDDLVTLLQPALWDGDGGDADHVDAHIVDVGVAVRAVCGHYFLGGDGLTQPDDLVVTGNDVEVDPVPLVDLFRRSPSGVIITDFVPAFD